MDTIASGTPATICAFSTVSAIARAQRVRAAVE
jgi:hypothetical protein